MIDRDSKLVESVAREMWEVVRAVDPDAPTGVIGPVDEEGWRCWAAGHPALANELRNRARNAIRRATGAPRGLDLRLKEAMVSWDLR